MLGIKPRAAGSESKYANLFAMLPPSSSDFLHVALFRINLLSKQLFRSKKTFYERINLFQTTIAELIAKFSRQTSFLFKSSLIFIWMKVVLLTLETFRVIKTNSRHF